MRMNVLSRRSPPSRTGEWRRCHGGLTEPQLKQVLRAFDRRTPCGLRDHVMVLCLATLGLRPSELAELHLEDIDWRSGTMQVRTRKTRRGERFYRCRARPGER
jgi:integrase